MNPKLLVFPIIFIFVFSATKSDAQLYNEEYINSFINKLELGENVCDICKIVFNVKSDINVSNLQFDKKTLTSEHQYYKGIYYTKNTNNKYIIDEHTILNNGSEVSIKYTIVRKNNKEYEYSVIKDMSGILRPLGKIKDIRKIYRFEPYLTHFNSIGETTSTYFKLYNTSHDMLLQIIDDVTYNSRDCVKVSTIDPSTKYEIDMYLAKNLKYLPIFIKYSIGVNNVFVEESIEYDSIEEFIYKKRVERETYQLNDGKKYWRRRDVFEATNIFINTTIDDSQFEIPFPENVEIIDLSS